MGNVQQLQMAKKELSLPGSGKVEIQMIEHISLSGPFDIGA